MRIKLTDEFYHYMRHLIEVDDYAELMKSPCFCGGGEFEIENINGKRTFLCIDVGCRKSHKCDNKFYKVNIKIAQECLDDDKIDRFQESHYDETKTMPEDMMYHNWEDIVLEDSKVIKLHEESELVLREYFYELYKTLIRTDPFEYDESFEI